MAGRRDFRCGHIDVLRLLDALGLNAKVGSLPLHKCVEDLQAPLALKDRNLKPEHLIKSSLSGPLGARPKSPMDKPELRPLS
ncbi:hypothetical protein TNCV_5072131 [Trichonephila clavipes]|nr:hypothetical protein TNCV_5072131 [Trichonephila clavipes]